MMKKIQELNKVFGSLKTDVMSASSDQIAFGLDGDDVLFSSNHFSSLSALIGGAGDDTYRISSQSMVFAIDSDKDSNDTYILGYGSRNTIFDNGGTDEIIALSIGLNHPETYTATFDNGKHIVVGNMKNLTHFMLPNWRNPSYEIERITLSDGTYSSSFLGETIHQRSNHIGDIPNDNLLAHGTDPEALSPAYWTNVMRYITQTEIEKSSEIESSSKQTALNKTLSIIVAPNVLDNKAVFLENLKETLIHQNGNLIAHTVEYAGTAYSYSDLDRIITTVTRDGEFTHEFAQEIADFDPGAAGVSYQTAVQLIGQAHINDTLLYVAGADGSYIS